MRKRKNTGENLNRYRVTDGFQKRNFICDQISYKEFLSAFSQIGKDFNRESDE